MVKRKTIGANPLDDFIQPTTIDVESENKAREQKNVAGVDKLYSQKKERITVQISCEIIERVKNAVYWTPGLTLAALTEQALTKAVDRLEKEKPFPQRKQELKTGRPIK